MFTSLYFVMWIIRFHHPGKIQKENPQYVLCSITMILLFQTLSSALNKFNVWIVSVKLTSVLKWHAMHTENVIQFCITLTPGHQKSCSSVSSCLWPSLLNCWCFCNYSSCYFALKIECFGGACITHFMQAFISYWIWY